MSYVILKKVKNMKHTVLVNDSEGMPIEFENLEDAQKTAELFRANTTRDSIYTVKKIS